MKNKNQKNVKSVLARAGIRIPLLIWSLVVLYPLAWMIIGAFKSNAEIYASPWGLPETWNFQNFADAWSTYDIGNAFFNSIMVTGGGTLLTIALALPTSYAIERVRFRGSTPLYYLYIAAMLIPVVLGWIPLFFILMNINLLDNLFGLTLVYALSQVPFSVFILTGFMSAFPKELEESAAIDGLSPYGTLWKVITPLSFTGIITVSVMNAIIFWNEYFMALIFLQSPENYTLGLAMDMMQSEAQYTNAWGTLFAGLTISIIPIIIIYAVFQQRISKGMTEGAIKG